MMSMGAGKRRDRLIQDKRHDVYQEKEKLPEPTRCPRCGAVFMQGRWTWNTAEGKAHETVCPACRRISDNLPAGHIELKGEFFAAHRDEIMNLVHNVESQEKSLHPLERIMAVTEEKGGVAITTTGVHLARGIGDALSRAWKGERSLHYGEAETSVRILWSR